jgi:hypothetical protein
MIIGAVIIVLCWLILMYDSKHVFKGRRRNIHRTPTHEQDTLLRTDPRQWGQDAIDTMDNTSP